MVVTPRELEVKLGDDRRLEVLVDGSPDRLALVFHPGTPTAAVPFARLFTAASERRLTTIIYSRPGYGASTEKHGRSVMDAVADVEGILDHLGMHDFVTVGWSGGGPHALACAAVSTRCLAAATIAGVAPYPAAGLDWMAGMAPENVEEFGLALKGEAALTPWLREQATTLAEIKGTDVAAALGGLVSDVDKDSLTGDFAEMMAASLRRAVSKGIGGWRDDDLAFVRDWGFDLGKIGRPVAIWQGAQDRMVPFAHGQWLAEQIPGARPRLYQDQGHLSIAVRGLDRILDDLVGLAANRG